MAKDRVLCIDLRWIDASGVGMYIKGILPGLIENLGDMSIVALGDRSRLKSFSWSEAANVTVVHCAARRYSLAEQVALPRAIPATTGVFFSPYYTIPLFYRGRLAVTVHDMSHMVVHEIVGNWKKRTYARVMYRAIRRRAEVIFTVSQFTRNEILRLVGDPVRANIVPTHLGIFPEWYTAKERARVRTRPYFVCVGNIKPYKNVARLVEAFMKAAPHIPHDLVIVGECEDLITGESPEFFKRVREAGDRVQMTGYVSHDELLSLVGHGHALVMPSLYEGFGLPPLEAMAAGVPVVVARAASLPEVCGEAAQYFDPLDVEDMAKKLVEIASDPSLCAQMIEAGRARSATFRWDSCARQTAQGLRACLESA